MKSTTDELFNRFNKLKNRLTEFGTECIIIDDPIPWKKGGFKLENWNKIL